MADRFLNLVFQGGGVRGAAYAGALQAVPPNYKIHTVAGASAGSIVAALVAIGKTPEAIKELLSDDEFFRLIQPSDSERTERLVRAFRDMRNAWDPKKKKLSLFQAWNIRRRHKSIFKDLSHVMAQKGMHRSQALRIWLDRVTEGKTFNDAQACEDLRIIAANVSKRAYEIYSKKNYGSRPIAEAVHASVSIPVFFEPFYDGTSFLVDGGLLSNFPAFLVGQGMFPTVGFRLDDFLAPEKIADPFSYLKALLLTMTDAHDKFRDVPDNFKTYPIYTAEIPTTKFNLTTTDAKTLFELGRGVGNGVEWEKYSAEKPEISYYDPKPQKALQNSLRQAYELWQSFTNQNMWLDTLKHEATFSAYIEKDWSTRYDRLGVVSVGGSRPLFVQQFRLSAAAPDLLGSLSLSDCQYIAEEVDPTGTKTPLIAIPAFNGVDQKGFLLFFTPPVAPGTMRTTHTEFKMPLEFANTLAKGKPDFVSYSAMCLAKDHQIKLLFRILVDSALPALKLQPQFGGKFVQQRDEADPNSGRFYRRYDCQLDWYRVGAVLVFRVELER
ncbi:MAG TPA: patatin-like phospholipase family protein [Bryobacteraceae bacterium]|nr:patatin-like phospholipase family protein [Bryobacteraceae bacterium]